MNRLSILCTLVFLCICCTSYCSHSPALLPSTEGDPDSFIEHSVSVINGDYCESVTDIAIEGPDVLLLQRYYNTKNYLTGEHAGGWRILPQLFLVIGEDIQIGDRSVAPDGQKCIRAFTGERSGGIFSYSGWRSNNSISNDPLRIDLLNDGLGMLNTYSKEMNGQTNHQNNQLHYNGETCELILGDGTRRLYQNVNWLPNLILGEELMLPLCQTAKDSRFFLFDSGNFTERQPSSVFL